MGAHNPLNEVQDVFRRFANHVGTNYGIKIKHIRSDNSTEFKNTCLDTYLDTLGITHEFSAPYTPQQNGIMERKNRTLIEMAWTMLDEYKTARKFWPKPLILHATSSTVFIFTSFERRHHTRS